MTLCTVILGRDVLTLKIEDESQLNAAIIFAVDHMLEVERERIAIILTYSLDYNDIKLLRKRLEEEVRTKGGGHRRVPGE